MKTNLLLASFLTLSSFVALPASGAPGDTVILNVKTTISVALAPTPDAPPSAASSAVIKVHRVATQANTAQSALLKLTASGFAPGKYKIVATLANASTPVIGNFRATATGKPAEIGKDDGKIVTRIPPSVDATKIVSVAILNASNVTIFEGDATTQTTSSNFIANIRVTGPNSFPGLGVHGHVTAHSKSVDGVEVQRQFLWVGFGAPPNTQLTINVDGTDVGTVTSTGQGKVIFNDLDDSVDLTTIQLITLVNSNTVIMQAQF